MDLLEHEIRVTFKYPVYFSRDVFAPTNPLVLKAAPSAVAPKAARILFVLDGGVDAAHPSLRESIGRYCAAHGGALELAAPVLVIPGGHGKAPIGPNYLSHASSTECDLSSEAQYRIVDYCGDVHLYPPKP